MDELKGKKVLLLYARFFNYDTLVKNKLTELGAVVDLYDARANIGKIQKAIKKIYRGYYFHKMKQYHEGILRNNTHKEYDFVFSNAYLPAEAIENYRKAYPKAKFVLYLDDSVENLKGVDKTFNLYDRVITFDRLDAKDYAIEFRPLFFDDTYTDPKKVGKQYDLCFIGTIHSDRLKVIEKIEDICQEKGLTFYKFCYLPSGFMYYYYWLTKKEFRKKPQSYFSYTSLPAKEVAKALSNSSIILDIQHPKQTGLTMRTIETLGSKKKLITTNVDIKEYDFYNERDICLIDREDPQIEDVFLKTEYEEINQSLYQKYSLNGWISFVFQ